MENVLETLAEDITYGGSTPRELLQRGDDIQHETTITQFDKSNSVWNLNIFLSKQYLSLFHSDKIIALSNCLS